MGWQSRRVTFLLLILGIAFAVVPDYRTILAVITVGLAILIVRKYPQTAAVVVIGLTLLVIGVWNYYRSPDLSTVSAEAVESVEVRFEPWGENETVQAGSDSQDPQVIAELVGVLRTGVETGEHKCANRGVFKLRRLTGTSLEFGFLPGHDPDWYEYRYAGKLFHVSRPRFLAVMARVGVQVPVQ